MSAITVCWEFADGSGGHTEYGDPKEAERLARDIAAQWPDARVWCGADQIQQGFIAADDRVPT